MGFKEGVFLDYIQNYGIKDPSWLDPNDIFEQFEKTGCTDWIPGYLDARMWIIKSFSWISSRLLVILFVLTACNPLGLTSDKEADFAALYPNIPFSNYLNLSLVEGSSLDNEFPVDVVIENVSDQIILLPPETDHVLYIFDIDQKEWRTVNEKMRYHPNSSETILYPEDDLDKLQFKVSAFPIHPDLALQDQPITVRLVLIGEIVENEQPTGKKVGVYIDITYKH